MQAFAYQGALYDHIAMDWRTLTTLFSVLSFLSCSGGDTPLPSDSGTDFTFVSQDTTTDSGSTTLDPGTAPQDSAPPADLSTPGDPGTPTDTAPAPDQQSLPDLAIADTSQAIDTFTEDLVEEEDTFEPVDTFVPPTDPGPPPDPCDGINCGPMGYCSGGACQCDPGYEANPPWSACSDVNECAQGLAACDGNATCSNTEGSYSCSCSPGFTDVNGDGSVCSMGYNACGVGRFSPKVGGTLANPMEVPYLPMVDHNNTAASPESNIATYDCAPDTLETGQEIVYRFVADHPGTFHAKLTDPAGVDIDIHLVQNPVMNGSQMTGCIGRAHEELTLENLPAGEYWVFADSWSSGSIVYSGTYTLAFEWISDNVWNEVPVDTGIVWSRLRSVNGADTQTINQITVELNHGWDLQPHKHSGCTTITSAGDSLNAIAGVNGGFFNGSCASLDLLRADGVTYSTNTMTGYEQRTMGWNQGAVPTFQWLDPNQDWTSVSDAIGGYPSLVTDGVGFAAAVQGEQVWSATDWARHPRTVTGIDNQNRLVMLTIDGRTSAGEGMTNPELATYLQGLGISQAIGLDGGGSTSMMVYDCWLNHVVNYPSDNNTADHYGLRSVADGFYIR